MAEKKNPVMIESVGEQHPCNIGHCIKATLSRPVDLKRLKPFTRAIGWVVELDEKENVINADLVTFSGSGYILSKARVERDASVRIGEAFQLVARSEQCTGCGACVERCTNSALYMKDGKVEIHEDECIFCKKCYGPCPAADLGKKA